MLNAILGTGSKQATPLDKAEAAIEKKDYPALAQAAKDIAALVPNNRYLVEPLLIVADRLAENKAFVPQAIAAAKVVGQRSWPGSDSRMAAVRIILKHVDCLPDVTQKIETATEAACLTPLYSELRVQAEAKLAAFQKEAQPVPAVPSEKDAQRFVNTFSMS